jgi:hypothetical protein
MLLKDERPWKFIKIKYQNRAKEKHIMAYNRIKDESNLIAKWKLKSKGKFYFHVFLWADQESFDQNTLDNTIGQSAGCCNLAPTIIKIFEDGSEEEIIWPKLGEIHFIKGKWSLEIVAHELCHALIQRIRMILPTANDIIEQIGDSEETICYEFGEWIEQIYCLLWKVDNPKLKDLMKL